MIQEPDGVRLVAAVLAGGASLRMGRDKAWIRVDGLSMIEHALAAATGAGVETAIIGRSPEEIPGAVKSKYPQVTVIPDDQPHAGPVGGLMTALRQFPDSDVLLLPCDTPGLTVEAVQWLAAQAMSSLNGQDWDAVVPQYDGHLQPLFAAYSQGAARAVNPDAGRFEDANRNSSLSFKALLPLIRCKVVELPGRFHPAVSDIDTPDDLASHSDAGL